MGRLVDPDRHRRQNQHRLFGGISAADTLLVEAHSVVEHGQLVRVCYVQEDQGLSEYLAAAVSGAVVKKSPSLSRSASASSYQLYFSREHESSWRSPYCTILSVQPGRR